MGKDKGFVTRFGEFLDTYHAEREAASQQSLRLPRIAGWLGKHLVPNLGSVLLVLVLLSVFPGLAAPNQAPSATSVSTIPYQGRLADASGNPITDKQNIEFRVYDVPTGGTPLWEEFWTGANSVNVSDGLFSVMLGSIEPGLADVVQANDELYLGITVGTDSEMAPRVQLGSVPFSMISLTVPDGSVTTEKIADGSVTQGKLGADISLEPPDGSITTAKLADNAVTAAKITNGAVGSSEVTDNSLTASDLAANSVGSSEIANGAATSNKVKLQNGTVGGSSVTLSESWQDIASTTIVADANLVVIAYAVLDISTASGATALGALNVDGTDVGGGLQVIQNYDGRGTVGQVYRFTIDSGTHTVKLRARKFGSAGSASISNHTVLTWFAFAQ